MTLRGRLALLLGALVAAFVIVSAVFNAWLADASLRDTVDQSLSDRADVFVARGGRGLPRPVPGTDSPDGRPVAGAFDPFSEAALRVQIIPDDGVVIGTSAIPIDDHVVAAVRTTGEDEYYTVDIDGEAFRVVTIQDGDVVLQLATSIESIEAGLGTLRRGLLLAGLTGIAAAVAAGWVVADRFTKPIVDVTAAAGRLANQELPEPIESDRTDEVGQLASSFNELVSALEFSRMQQVRLVGDAGHELRTPLTSLRVKIDFLNSQPTMPSDERQQILAGAALELESLTSLVSELVELASHGSEEEDLQTVDLGLLVEDAADRARLLTQRPIIVSTAGTQVKARPEMVKRALSNLIENAHKFSPPGSSIEIHERSGEISVHDHGPGIAAEDRPDVFDRFFRSASGQTRAGSGIGLAIVKSTADAHGGRVWIDDTDGGGVVVGFSISPPA